LIDLHTHTTASDGRCTPEELVARAAAAGVRVLAVTDHDTVGGCARAAAACAAAAVEFVPGIEITAVVDGGDVHLLGYFIDTQAASLGSFLAEQRRRRVERVRRMIGRLHALGIPLDADAILRPGLEDTAKAVGRPWIARALVAGGHAADMREAFERWLVRGRPAFEPRIGPAPAEVVERIHQARGLASLAHPALLDHDEWIPDLAGAGLDAIEAYHSAHDETATRRYLALAARHGLAVSGGSDYHADEAHDAKRPGSVTLPADAYAALVRRRAATRASASGSDTSS